MTARCTTGVVLFVGDGASTEKFKAVADVTAIPELLNYSVQPIDVTTLADTYKKFRGGVVDSGSVSFDVNFDPTDATHNASGSYGLLSKIYNMCATTNFVIGFPLITPAQYLALAGVVTGFKVSAAQNDVLRASVTIKISGSPTWGTTAPTLAP